MTLVPGCSDGVNMLIGGLIDPGGFLILKFLHVYISLETVKYCKIWIINPYNIYSIKY